MPQFRERSPRTDVSILLPTFNSAKFLDEQLHSILLQTFADFELLIYDDGSHDETAAIVRKWQALDIRVFAGNGSINEGQNRCLIRLLRHARGRFVAFSDHDDVWHSSKLERLYDGLTSSKAGMAFGASHLIDASDHSLGETLHDRAQLDICPDDHLRLLFFPLVSGHSVLIERDLVWEGAFSGPMLFDWHLALDAQFTRGIAFVPEAITYHRIHDTNSSNGDLAKGARDVRFWRDLRVPRSLLFSGHEDRLRFYQRISYLANSPIVPRDTQSTFQEIVSACEKAWFSATPRRLASSKRCRDVLRAKLLPLASSERDRESAHRNILALCSPLRRRRAFTIAR